MIGKKKWKLGIPEVNHTRIMDIPHMYVFNDIIVQLIPHHISGDNPFAIFHFYPK